MDTMNGVHIDFQVDQKVVYPSQGVGNVVSLSERDFKNNRLLYYEIYFEASDMTSMIPVAKAKELGIRSIVSPEEAELAVDFMSEKNEPSSPDWKIRYQTNIDLLKRGSIMDIATIVRSLYQRSQSKELPIMERKLLESALKLMKDEVAFSLQKTREEVEAMIFEKLARIKLSVNEDDEETELVELGDSDAGIEVVAGAKVVIGGEELEKVDDIIDE